MAHVSPTSGRDVGHPFLQNIPNDPLPNGALPAHVHPLQVKITEKNTALGYNR
jgi:hypothetical protein